MRKTISKPVNGNDCIVQDFRYTYDDFRNLASRTEAKYAMPMTETFRYDNLDRLDTVLFNNTVSEMVYDVVKIYVSNCEYVFGLSRLQRLTYLTGPMGVFAVYEELSDLYKDGDSDDVDGFINDSLTDNIFTGALYYLHRDHLGSVTTVTNVNGAIVQELSYDAWGNLRNPYTWSGSFTGTPKFDRGYTGHEHLWRYGLINMNGRVYDPVMSCFLSVDTYVQDPENPQNFNRYAYCLNNPLRYVDPEGEWFLTGGLDFGKRSDGTYGVTGISLGVNFGFAGAGVHVNWADGVTVGAYGEIGPHIGNAGLTTTLGVDYNFKYHTTTASLSVGYGFSYGIGRAGLVAGGSYTWGLPSGVNPWNAGVSVSLGVAGNISKFGQQAGLGLSCSYGTQGWNFGAHSFCEYIPMTEKFNRIMDLYYAKMSGELGEAFACFYLGTNKNLAMDGMMSWFGQIDTDKGFVNGIVRAEGLEALGENDDGFGMIPYSRAYISKSTTLKIWFGSARAIETLYHEYYHTLDYYSGDANRIAASVIEKNNSRIISDILEVRAYYYNYGHTGNDFYLNRAKYYYNRIPDAYKYLCPTSF